MAYASYDYYISNFYGKAISSIDEFNRLAERASEYIDAMTMYRAKTYDDSNNELKKACCAIAEFFITEESNQGKNSESVGSWSVSYVSQKELNTQKVTLLKHYLIPTGLLYTGMGW